MGKNNLHIGHFKHPLRVPVKRDKAVVIDAGKRVHDFINRKIALSDEAEAALAVLKEAVLHVNMLDIGAEVFDCFLRILMTYVIRRINVPEGGKVIVGILHEEGEQLFCIAEHSGGFNKHCYALFCRGGNNRGKNRADIFIAFCTVAGSKKAQIRNFERGSEKNTFFNS